MAAVPDRGVAFFPSGVYDFPKALSFTDKAVLVMGVARECVTLVFSGATDGIVFYVTTDQSKRVGVRDMRVLAGNTSNQNGTAIKVRMPPTAATGANYVYRQMHIDNVQLGTLNDDPHNAGPWWNWGFIVTNVWYPYITNVDHFANGAAAGFLQITADATASDGHYYGSIAPILSNCKAFAGACAILATGYLEGLEATMCDFVGFQYGVRVPSTTTPGGAGAVRRAYALWFTNCHFNVSVCGFFLNTCQDLKLTMADCQSLHNPTQKQDIRMFDFYDMDIWAIIGGSISGGYTYSDGSQASDVMLYADGSGTGDAGVGGRVNDQGTRNGTVLGTRRVGYGLQAFLSSGTKNNGFYLTDDISSIGIANTDQGLDNKLLLANFATQGLIYNGQFQNLGEFRPSIPIRFPGFSRYNLLTNYPADGYGSCMSLISNPVAGKSKIVASDGSNWLYMDGTVVTNI